VVLTNVRVIDGSGAAPKENQAIVIRDGNIAEMGDASRVKAFIRLSLAGGVTAMRTGE
jgi:N-acyl-D-aspartate/D-glutamate deacylase